MDTITIDPKEIIDWLRQRRKINDQWVQKHKALKPKIKEITDHIRALNLPETRDFFQAKGPEADAQINFLDLLALNDMLLKSKEAEVKTIFGGYSSKTIKELHALIKVFEKENIGVASLATELSQILSFEVPGAKKIIKSNEGQVADLQYKLSLYASSINNAKSSILKLIQKYHKGFSLSEDEVETFNVENFLNQFIMLLPLKIKVFLNDLSKVEVPKLVDYYVRFSKANNFEDLDPKDFDILSWLYSYGDSLVTDFEAGVPPDPNLKDQLYHPLLIKNGYLKEDQNVTSQGQADGLQGQEIDESEWLIEDITDDQSQANPQAPGRTAKINEQKHIDTYNTLLTFRPRFNEIVERLSEVC